MLSDIAAVATATVSAAPQSVESLVVGLAGSLVASIVAMIAAWLRARNLAVVADALALGVQGIARGVEATTASGGPERGAIARELEKAPPLARRFVEALIQDAVRPAALLLVALVLAGCCSSRVHESAQKVRQEFNVYRRATVAKPSLGPEGVAYVASLAEAVDRQVALLEDLTK